MVTVKSVKITPRNGVPNVLTIEIIGDDRELNKILAKIAASTEKINEGDSDE